MSRDPNWGCVVVLTPAEMAQLVEERRRLGDDLLKGGRWHKVYALLDHIVRMSVTTSLSADDDPNFDMLPEPLHEPARRCFLNNGEG
jgi:hypothetical protein